VIGGGLPVGAFGGRRDVLSVLAPLGPVYQAGTLSGNPLATAAGRTVLEHVTAADYASLAEAVGSFAASLRAVLDAALDASGTTDASGRRLTARVPVVGPLFGLYFVPDGSPDVSDYDGAVASADTGLYARLFREMLARGVALAPGPYEVAFPRWPTGPPSTTARWTSPRPPRPPPSRPETAVRGSSRAVEVPILPGRGPVLPRRPRTGAEWQQRVVPRDARRQQACPHRGGSGDGRAAGAARPNSTASGHEGEMHDRRDH